MGNLISKIIQRVFFNEETVIFAFLLLLSGFILFFFGNTLLPILLSLVIAFLLNGLVNTFKSLGFSQTLALIFSLMIFFGSYLALFFLLPLVGIQINALLGSLPNIINSFKSGLLNLSSLYPDLFSDQTIKLFLDNNKKLCLTLLRQNLH